MSKSSARTFVVVTVEERWVRGTARAVSQITKEAIKEHRGIKARYDRHHYDFRDVKRWASRNKVSSNSALVIRSSTDRRWLFYKLPGGDWKKMMRAHPVNDSEVRIERQQPTGQGSGDRSPARRTPTGPVNAQGSGTFTF